MWMVVGLGNPGREYENTRHNVGFMVVDALAKRQRATFAAKFKGEAASTPIGTETALLLKPHTYMNLSGQSVQAAMAFYKIELAKIIVVHDDLDLVLGQIKIKVGGSPGGHNGLKSIDQSIGQQYARIRAGIGHPRSKAPEGVVKEKGQGVVSHVLGAFKGKDAEEAALLIEHCADAVGVMMKDGLVTAQQRYHSLKPPG